MATYGPIFSGGIRVAKRYRSKTAISLVGVGAHDVALHVLQFNTYATLGQVAASTGGSGAVPIDKRCKLCSGEKPAGLKESRDI